MSGLYGYRWQRASRNFLITHPLCMCPLCGAGTIRVRAASVVDHIRPHKGDRNLFWNVANWQALAKECHDGYKQRFERSGRVEGARLDGTPIDPAHPWNNEGKGIGG